MRNFPAAVVLLSLLAPGPAAVAQTCPANQFSMGGGYFFQDSSTLPSYAWFGSSYNLVAGTIAVGTSGSGELGSFEQLLIQDLYTLVGPASATPIGFVARVRFTGSAGGGVVDLPSGGPTCLGSSARLRLASGAVADEKRADSYDAPDCGPRAFDEILNLALAKLPGEEFPLSVQVSLNAGHTIPVQASGQIEFVGMPPGYTVQSCQGYAVLPVAAKPTTWGKLKRLYR